MVTEPQWYSIKDTDELDSPALVVYPDRVKENIQTAIKMIDDPIRLRPHVKTHKTMEAAKLLMAAGINKFKCATIAEAEMLGMCGCGDVLMAYQPFGPKIERFITLIKKYPETKFSCLIDNLETAKSIAGTAHANNLLVPVYIDLNVGMNRTGIKPDEIALQLYEHADKLTGMEVMGLHAYDGHVREKDIEKRTAICNDIYVDVDTLKQHLKSKGYKGLNIIIGGSPTFPVYAKIKDVECSPGTFIFWDKGYLDAFPEQDFVPAALVICRIVSMPDETKICLDLGCKSVATENDLNRRIYFLNAPGLKIVSQSEEHLVLETDKDHQWKIGDIFYGLPIHICPTCALYENASLIENGEVSGSWEIIARNRKITV